LIRHSIDTKDPFYTEEQNFVDEAMPLVQSSSVKFTNALLASPFKKELEMILGDLIFKKAELSKKTFSDEIIEDLQLENKYGSEYVSLRSSARIEFDGNTYTLAQLAPFTTHKDRSIRKRAAAAVSSWFKSNEAAFDEIYHN